MKTSRALLLALVISVFYGLSVAEAAGRFKLDIESQPLGTALMAFGEQSGIQVLMKIEDEAAEKMNAPRLVGEFTIEGALQRLLANSGLRFEFINERTVWITHSTSRGQVDIGGTAVNEPFRLVQNSASESEGQGEDGKRDVQNGKDSDEEIGSQNGIPEILVTGSKMMSLNSDIRRTENDIQPYVIFDRKRLERSGAATLEEFFKGQLTMSTSVLTATQQELLGGRSQINLRGLGTDETLILIDGRRAGGFNFNGTPQQPDINGIPLAAVERVEVLPTTASGIFGGSATGGAINIVLRRDYKGFETRLTYANSFKGDVADRRVDLSAGINFEGGKTNLLIAGSYSDANSLLVEERDFIQRGRQHLLRTNSASFVNAFNPPLGSTPNIRSNDGTNLILDDSTALNSPFTFVPVGYAGVATDGGTALVGNAGNFNLDLASTAQNTAGGRYGLLSAPQSKALMMTLRREFTPHIQAFVELQASDNSTEYPANFADLTAFIPGDAPNNPFQQTIRVTIPTVGMDEAVASKSNRRRVVTGAIVELTRDWQAALDFTWNRSSSSYARPISISPATAAAVNSGSLDVLRDLRQFPVEWEGEISQFQSPGEMKLHNTALRLAGPLPWSLPGGSVALASLVEHREESLGDVIICSFCDGSPSLFPARSQTIDSVYMEARLPLVAALNKRFGVELLEMQLAIRGDDYSVTGATRSVSLENPTPIERFVGKNSSLNPTIGLRYQPVRDLMIRGSFGTGYLPPSMSQIAPEPSFPNDLTFRDLVDPLRGNEPIGTVTWLQGGNPNLRPEESESWSAGLIFMPHALPGLRIAADWSRIEKIDNIGVPFSFSQTTLETLIKFFPERLTRGEPSNGFSIGPITGLDNTLINIALMRVESLDLAADYRVETNKFGTFDLSADATYLISRETQAAPSAATIENAGVMLFGDSALDWNISGSVNWAYGGWTLGWQARFFNSYFLNPAHSFNRSQGAASVPSQSYHDLYGGYRFALGPRAVFGLFANTEIRFGINNVFNKVPPIDVVHGGTLMYSRLGDPRLINYYMSIRKSFGNVPQD